MANTVTKRRLPRWAEEWVPGHCQCGARLCRAACYCGGHTVCSASGTGTDKCKRKATTVSNGSSSAPADTAPERQ